MEIIRGKRSFDLDEFLKKPLFAHLSTASSEGPRESPVWFFWEDKCLWIIGTPGDTFPIRIDKTIRIVPSVLLSLILLEGQYANRASLNRRRDIGALYARCLMDVSLYVEDGANIMIEHGWMEQPPIVVNRNKLTSKDQYKDRHI